MTLPVESILVNSLSSIVRNIIRDVAARRAECAAGGGARGIVVVTFRTTFTAIVLIYTPGLIAIFACGAEAYHSKGNTGRAECIVSSKVSNNVKERGLFDQS